MNIKSKNLKLANMRSGITLPTLNNTKIQNTSKCNIERIKASDKRFLFVCGDIELNKDL